MLSSWNSTSADGGTGSRRVASSCRLAPRRALVSSGAVASSPE